ncbi:hypothetical protein EV424DRAFT_1540875 [Suillus variegatus]|nr:hypothetical protein EV424DRAFT_1540875 [Suillus variegatus]
MEKPSTMLIEQLRSVHSRQRKVIQQLQADNARLLSDLVEVCRERDAFRAEAAKLRKEQAELHNRLDGTLSEYRGLRRERLTLSRAFSMHLLWDGHQMLIISRELPELVIMDDPQMDQPVRSSRKLPTTAMPVPRVSLYALDMDR